MEHPAPVEKEFHTAIVWFRRDLRVDDNPALVAALNAATVVVPVFIWAPEEEGQFQPGRCSRWWTKHSLVDLQQALAALGSRLIIRRSTDSTASLLQVVSDVRADAVFFNHLYDPISLMRDHDCKRGLSAAGVTYRTFNSDLLYEPWEVLDENQQPLSTFAAFWASVRAMPTPPPFPVPAPATMPAVATDVSSLPIGEVGWFFTAEQEASSDQLKFKWKPGVGGAIAELEHFLAERLCAFEHDRAKVDRDSTSRLSPWIHIGSISVRYIFYRVRQCQAEWAAAGADRSVSCDDFLQQMGYREYSRYLSFHFPFIHERSLLRHLRACPWRIDQQTFKAWRQGQTGYPLVDAAMRQLWSSGWCHNRGRVVAASFLVKDLLLPWQWGLKHFWDAQIDADLECDSLGWQYVSGGMSDAHPFSYMMDLEKEAGRFDADGEYVRRWLPVLSRLPTEYIHAPWKAPPQVLAAADVELGCNYPLPVITMNDARANVEYACSVLEKCQVAQASESSGRDPYRAPTQPYAASSGANPTAAFTRTGTGNGTSAGTAGQTGTGTGTGTTAFDGSNRSDSRLPSQDRQQSLWMRGGEQSYGATGTGMAGANGTGDGTPDGHAKLPDSRTASAAGGGSSGVRPFGSAGVAPSVGGAAASLQRQLRGSTGSLPGPASGIAAAPQMAPGGGQYYHPGDAAGQQLLERILQQQRQARGAAGLQDGSGTNNPPAYYQHQQQQRAAAAAQLESWAGATAEELDEEALQRWQEQQGMPAGAAAAAFQQAMQLILSRRRAAEGVSMASGERGSGGEDEDSEEVVSNTVNCNMTCMTGASYQRQPATARGARRQAHAGTRSAGASKGVHSERPRRSLSNDEDDFMGDEGRGAAADEAVGDGADRNEAQPERELSPARAGEARSGRSDGMEESDSDSDSACVQRPTHRHVVLTSVPQATAPAERPGHPVRTGGEGEEEAMAVSPRRPGLQPDPEHVHGHNKRRRSEALEEEM